LSAASRGLHGQNKKRYTLAGVVAVALAAVLYTLPRTQDTAAVIRVVDGDTLKINYQGRPESVRLIGIDTPESRVNAKAKRDAGRSRQSLRTIILAGQQAKHFVQGLVKPGDPLQLEFDVQQRDKYGRLLGYAYLSDGRMLNEVIIRSGYANPMTIPPNMKYQERFLLAFRLARQERAGLWKKSE